MCLSAHAFGKIGTIDGGVPGICSLSYNSRDQVTFVEVWILFSSVGAVECVIMNQGLVCLLCGGQGRVEHL